MRRSMGFLAMICLAIPGTAGAHSASDAYLTLTAGGTTLHGQWDIAIRDLDFVLKLDEDGDGRVTWGELRRKEAAIQRYAYQHLTIDGGPGNPCRIEPVRQLVDGHADGAYAALFFDAICARAPRTIALDYTLFFAIDPSHRGIVVLHDGASVATAVVSPQNSRINLLR
jgi:hypothetical protein